MKNKSDSQATEFEKFDTLLKRVIAVPKAEIDRREEAYKKRRKEEKSDAGRKTT